MARTRRSGKRKAARKPKAKAKAKAAEPKFKTHTFKYFCDKSTCTAKPFLRHMNSGDIAVMISVGTDATLNFAAAGGSSPFVSGADPINLTAGVPQAEVIKPGNGTYDYKLTCSVCAGGPSGDPSMRVP